MGEDEDCRSEAHKAEQYSSNFYEYALWHKVYLQPRWSGWSYILYSYEAMNILFYWLKWGQIAFGDLSVWQWHGSQPGTRQKPQKRNPRSIFPLYSGLRLQAWKKLISEEKVVQSSKSQKTGRDFPDHSTVHDATFLMISWAEKIHSQVIRLALTKWLIWVVWAVSLMFKMSQACVCYNSYLEHSQ